jgi:hypothetical protein
MKALKKDSFLVPNSSDHGPFDFNELQRSLRGRFFGAWKARNQVLHDNPFIIMGIHVVLTDFGVSL